jgi:hypothetical protein
MLKKRQKSIIIDDENGGVKMIKNRSKMTPYKFVQKVLKNQFLRGGSGGVKMIKIEGGVPGGRFYKFF